MVEIQLIDRSLMIAAVNREIKLVPSSTAIVAIDMHSRPSRHAGRNHADTPEDAERVIGNAQKLLRYARSLGVSIVHVKLVMRRLRKGGSEINNVPFWQALQKVRNENDRLTPGRRSSVNEHNLEGSPGTEIIPGLSRRATTSSIARNGLTALWAPISTSCSTASVFALSA